MAHDFACDEDLLDRLAERPHDLVFLVGSAVTAPSFPGEPGVPFVAGVIEQVRRVYTRPEALARFEQALAAAPANQHYQIAFRHLQRTRGQDLANAIIRRCVLQARVPSTRFPNIDPDTSASDLCRDLERDLDGWHLPPAVAALGQLLASMPASVRPVVLTSNFDPLISVSIHRAGGQAYTTALHSDGGFAALDGQGTLVVHFHGDWFRSDTLHTPAGLHQDRPRLAASLAQLLSARTLVVLGYGGWDDIFTRSLAHVLHGELAAINVLWAFYGADEAQLERDYASLLATLAPGISRARVMLYKGVNAHQFLPRLVTTLGITTPPAPTRTPPPTPTSSTPPVAAGTTATVSMTHGQISAGDSILGPIVEVLPDANPFQKAGALAPTAPSYVARAADAALRQAIADHPLIVLRGDFSLGKSSMLLRADQMWHRGNDAVICHLDLMEMRIDDVNLFYPEFFAAVGRCFGQPLQGWPELSRAIAQRPLMITIDEFSGLTTDVAHRFVPALLRWIPRHSDGLRIVVTARDPIATVLAKLQLDNPNLGEWFTVDLAPFSPSELDTLLALLPAAALRAAKAEAAALRQHSGMCPRPAQCLCFNLFKDVQAGRSEVDLAARVRDKDSYR